MKSIQSPGAEQLDGADLINDLGMDYFQNASVFGALSPTTIKYLLTQGRVLHLCKDDVLYKPGDDGDKFFVVLKGRFAFYQFYRNEFAYIRDHLFGEEIGFVAMIALHERIGKAVAAEDCCVLEISCNLFHQLHKQDPHDFGLFLLNLSREMARTIREVSNLVVESKRS